MRNYTDITILLDRSGSMRSIRESMEQAYDTFIKEHRAIPSTRVTLIQFDDHNDQDVVYQNVPVSAVESLRLKPRGNTPLVDAFCKTIDLTGKRLAAMPEYDRPDQVLMVVITDGAENASMQYRRTDVRQRVRHQTLAYKWQFVYLGANQDTFAEATGYGIPHTHAFAFASQPQSVNSAYRSLTANTVSYAGNAVRQNGVPDFTEAQRKQALETETI